MSLVLATLLIAGGALCGGWAARRLARAEEPEAGEGPEAPGAKASRAPASAETIAARAFAAFPCRVGDVIVAMDGQEAWLAGALLFSEEAPVAALFIAPNPGRDHAVFVRPSPSDRIVWLAPIDLSELGFAREPPPSIEHDGERYERVRRLPLRVQRYGDGAPEIGETVIVLEYQSPTGGELVMLASGGTVVSWGGRALGPGMYDILPAPEHGSG